MTDAGTAALKSAEYRRAWPVLLSSAIGTGVGVAVLSAYSIGALAQPLEREFGWTRAQIMAAPLFYAVATLLVGALVGGFADRYGARRVAIVSQVLLAVAFAALSQLGRNVAWLYAGFFALAVFGAGTLPVIWSRVITGWFLHSRGLALGLSLMGTGLVGAVLPSYVSWLVSTAGWSAAFAGLAVLPVAIGLPTTLLFLREPPQDQQRLHARSVTASPPPDPDSFSFRGAIRTRCFWQMSAAFMVVAVAVSAVLSNSQSLLMDRGIPRATAAALLGLFGIAISLGRLVSGQLLDLFRGPSVAAGMFALPALACVLLISGGANLWLCGLAIVLVGLAGGAEHDIAAYFTAKYFGRGQYGAIYGLLYALYGLGAGAGPLLAGAVFDATGSYDVALYGGLAVFVVAAAAIGTLSAPPGLPSSLAT